MTSDYDRIQDSNDAWARRGARGYNSFSAHPFAWALGLVLVIIALSIGGCALGFVGSWGHEAKRVVSVKNVREQTTQVISDRTALEQAAINACEARDSKREDGDPTLVEDPSFAYRAQYRSIKADYDRRMSNFFEAAEAKRLPLPDGINGYPRTAPSLNKAIATARQNGDC